MKPLSATQKTDALQVHARTCTHHNDAERAAVTCPVCLMRENAALLEQVANFSNPTALHIHCVRHLTDAQVAHLFGERMTEIVNENAALRAKLADAHRTMDELVTDANAITLAQSLQRKCAELDQLLAEKARLETAIRNCLNWSNGREYEWGERAENAFKFLHDAVAK